MAWSYADTINASWEENQGQRARALAALEEARLTEDYESFRAAREALFEVDQRAAWIAQKANHLMARQSGPAPNPHGLSPTEVEHAHASTSYGSKDEREAIYAAQKAKLHHMRATGQYRQTTEQTG